jgi:hypothetical protein
MSDSSEDTGRDGPLDPGPEIDPKAPMFRAEGVIASALLLGAIGVGAYYYAVERHEVPSPRRLAAMQGNVPVDRGVYGPVLIGTDAERGAVELDDALARGRDGQGRTVKVRGSVGRVLSDAAFVLERGGLAPGSAEMVVIAPGFPDRDITLRKGDEVIVEGTVERFDPALVQQGQGQGQGGVGLDGEAVAKLSGQLVIWAAGAAH